MLNFNLLRVFYEVARTSSATQAAKRLFISQPAVSNDLKKLNDLIGFQLLKKTSKGMQLTRKGEALYQYIKKIFDIEKEIEAFLLQIDEVQTGTVSLGFSTLYARYLISKLTKFFHEAFPGIILRYYSGSSQAVLTRLKNLQIEIAVAARYLEIPSIEYIPFRKEKLVLLASMKHDFVKKGIIEFQELANQRFIMKEYGSATGETVKSAFEKRNINPDIVAELVNLDVILEMIEDNQGVAFLPELIMNHLDSDRNLITIDISDESLYFNSYLAVQKNEKLSPAAQRLMDVIRVYGQIADNE